MAEDESTRRRLIPFRVGGVMAGAMAWLLFGTVFVPSSPVALMVFVVCMGAGYLVGTHVGRQSQDPSEPRTPTPGPVEMADHWGIRQCEVLDPTGDRCWLAEGHAGIHRTWTAVRQTENGRHPMRIVMLVVILYLANYVSVGIALLREMALPD